MIIITISNSRHRRSSQVVCSPPHSILLLLLCYQAHGIQVRGEQGEQSLSNHYGILPLPLSQWDACGYRFHGSNINFMVTGSVHIVV